MLRLKIAYTKVFPLTSVRRFIVDQFISWFTFLGYYIGIALTIIVAVTIILHFIGTTGISIFQIKDIPGRSPIGNYLACVGLGYLFLCGIGLAALIIIGITVGLYAGLECDYLNWYIDQEKYIDELEKGRIDIEAERIPITITKFQKLNYAIFPLGSLYRYFGRLVLYFVCISVLLYCHICLSLFTFPVSPKDMPWPITWFVSSCIQFIIGMIIFGIYCCFEEPCTKEWIKFKQQSLSAYEKK